MSYLGGIIEAQGNLTSVTTVMHSSTFVADNGSLLMVDPMGLVMPDVTSLKESVEVRMYISPISSDADATGNTSFDQGMSQFLGLAESIIHTQANSRHYCEHLLTMAAHYQNKRIQMDCVYAEKSLAGINYAKDLNRGLAASLEESVRSEHEEGGIHGHLSPSLTSLLPCSSS